MRKTLWMLLVWLASLGGVAVAAPPAAPGGSVGAFLAIALLGLLLLGLGYFMTHDRQVHESDKEKKAASDAKWVKR